jgi:cation transport ATPase
LAAAPPICRLAAVYAGAEAEAIALIVLARQTVRRVRFNIIAFALGVNALAILAAGLGT